MKRLLKWLLLTLLGLVLLLGAALALVQHWLGTPDFRTRVEHEVSTALGVAVTVQQLQVALWPQPAVTATHITLQTRPALQLGRLDVRPVWADLLHGRLVPDTLLLRDAVLPQAGLEALTAALQRQSSAAPTAPAAAPLWPRRAVLENVSWVPTQGSGVTVNAEVRWSGASLPDQLSATILKGRWPGTTAHLQRQGSDWTLDMKLAEGTVKGTFSLPVAPAAGATRVLQGQLQTRAVQVAPLIGGATPVLSGRLDADTMLSARGTSVSAMVEALQTDSRFTVRKAVLHGIDLAKAVKTVGLNRGGETALDTLAGRLVTRGRALQLQNLAASSGVLSASGNVAATPAGALSGRLSVELAAAALGGAVAVPLVVGGTLNAPEVTLTRGALIGAAIGTAVMPGVGTGAGVSIGDKVDQGLKKLFGR